MWGRSPDGEASCGDLPSNQSGGAGLACREGAAAAGAREALRPPREAAWCLVFCPLPVALNLPDGSRWQRLVAGSGRGHGHVPDCGVGVAGLVREELSTLNTIPVRWELLSAL